jgi:hypothetical protein
MKTKNEIMVKPYSPAELSKLYGVSKRTLRRWVSPLEKKVGKRIGQFYTVKQVEVLFKHLGLPYCLEIINVSFKSFNDFENN